MKFFIPTLLAVTAQIAVISGLPAAAPSEPAPIWNQIGQNGLGPVYSTVAPQKRDVESWNQIGENDLGPVFSTIPPQKREETSWTRIGENKLGPVYSNTLPGVTLRPRDPALSYNFEGYAAWLAEESSAKDLTTRDEAIPEKRDLVAQVAICMMSCKLSLTNAVSPIDNTQNRVRFCLGQCLVSVGFTAALQTAYLLRYGDAQFPTSISNF